ncbi:MAG: hypothetical protein K8I30_17820 [Anaerolineae bacterium]|nr:hypothetical protein [Anaerolineae bacterium]
MNSFRYDEHLQRHRDLLNERENDRLANQTRGQTRRPKLIAGMRLLIQRLPVRATLRPAPLMPAGKPQTEAAGD